MITSDIKALVGELQERGITAEITSEGRLRVTPAAAIDADLAERIKRHRDELVALLRGDDPRQQYATADGDPRPTYSPSDDPPPPPDTPDEAAVDMLILSYGLGRRARALAAMGERCPGEIGEQVRRNLEPLKGVMA